MKCKADAPITGVRIHPTAFLILMVLSMVGIMTLAALIGG